MSTEHPRGYRSIFWPILLVGVGVIWLLANLEIIPGWNWWNLWRLWPLLLVVIGLDLLFGRHSPVIGALLGLATVAAAVAVLLAAPTLGWTPNPQVISESFREPLGPATSAQVDLYFPLGETTIEALRNSTDLIQIDGTHVGHFDFSSTGEASKRIRLQEVGVGHSPLTSGHSRHKGCGGTPALRARSRLSFASIPVWGKRVLI